VRIYTREPSEREPSEDAMGLRRGATVAEFAWHIYSDLFRNFKYAKNWGSSARFNGEKVSINHISMDRDAVEIHTM
jgi:ribosome-interacting GTPase 1